MKVNLSKIKKVALDLYSRGQMPKALALAIQRAKNDDTQEYISKLKELSEHYLRVMGYYKRYPAIHEETNSQLDCMLNDLRKGVY